MKEIPKISVQLPTGMIVDMEPQDYDVIGIMEAANILFVALMMRHGHFHVGEIDINGALIGITKHELRSDALFELCSRTVRRSISG